MTDRPPGPAPIRPFGAASWAVAGVVLVLGLSYLVRDLRLIHDGLAINDYVRLGRDFVNVWHGGALASGGHAATLYDLDAYRESLWQALGVRGIYAYSYPPHSLFLAIAFSLLPYGPALAAWTLIGLALFVHAARPYLAAAGLPWWVAALLPAGFVNIWAAHYGFFIGAASLYGWRQLEARPTRAGLAFALMTIKPHLGLLIALALLMRREWRAIGWTAGFTLALALAAAALFGWGLWPVYLLHTLGFHATLLDAPAMAFHAMMPTTTMAARQIGLPQGMGDAAQIISALAALAVVLRCARARVGATDLGLIAATAIFLVLPYAFIYDMTVQSLAALVFAARAAGPQARRDRIVLLCAFLLPLLQMSLAQAGIPLAPPILLAALFVQMRIALSGRDGPAGAGAAHSA